MGYLRFFKAEVEQFGGACRVRELDAFFAVQWVAEDDNTGDQRDA